jgi:hypothetical protein
VPADFEYDIWVEYQYGTPKQPVMEHVDDGTPEQPEMQHVDDGTPEQPVMGHVDDDPLLDTLPLALRPA